VDNSGGDVGRRMGGSRPRPRPSSEEARLRPSDQGETGSSMESTSGAASSRPLRGGPEGAALSRPGVLAKARVSGVARSWSFTGSRTREVRSHRGASPRRERRAASIFAKGAQHPSEASHRRCCGLTTRGVRADRVGVKRPPALERAARAAQVVERRPAPGRWNLGWRIVGRVVGLRPRSSADGAARTWRARHGLAGAQAFAGHGRHVERRESGGRRGGARGLVWLQRSTSGARSKVERPWV